MNDSTESTATWAPPSADEVAHARPVTAPSPTIGSPRPRWLFPAIAAAAIAPGVAGVVAFGGDDSATSSTGVTLEPSRTDASVEETTTSAGTSGTEPTSPTTDAAPTTASPTTTVPPTTAPTTTGVRRRHVRRRPGRQSDVDLRRVDRHRPEGRR